MTINNSISKYDWQYILSASLLISVFILTDLIGVIDKEYFYFVPKLISDQPYRIFTSILVHADLNHLLSNIGGIIITRYFLMRLGIESRFFYLKFILICSFLNFFIIWFYEKILSYFLNLFTTIQLYIFVFKTLFFLNLIYLGTSLYTINGTSSTWNRTKKSTQLRFIHNIFFLIFILHQ